MPTLRQPHIFISFRTEERAAAEALKSALEKGGFSVWWQENIQCGREWHGDIDAALLSAGCVVVLWSPESIKSQWVKHEASQAVARGVYTPVRLVPMEIGSPFDRIQATDLFGWKGESNHPGLERLLRRADELIPKPLSIIERAGRFVRRNIGAIASIAVAAAAIGMLVALKLSLDPVAHSVQRILQPLSDVSISSQWQLDSDAPGVPEFIDVMQNLNGGFGISVNLATKNDIIPAWLSHFNSQLLRVGFTRREHQGSEQRDLEIFTSLTDKSSQHRAWLSYAADIGKALVTLSDRPSTQQWRSNGEILSILDLPDSIFFIEFISRSNDAEEERAVRRRLKLLMLTIEVAGRVFIIPVGKLKETLKSDGSYVYSGDFSKVVMKQ